VSIPCGPSLAPLLRLCKCCATRSPECHTVRHCTKDLVLSMPHPWRCPRPGRVGTGQLELVGLNRPMAGLGSGVSLRSLPTQPFYDPMINNKTSCQQQIIILVSPMKAYLAGWLPSLLPLLSSLTTCISRAKRCLDLNLWKSGLPSCLSCNSECWSTSTEVSRAPLIIMLTDSIQWLLLIAQAVSWHSGFWFPPPHYIQWVYIIHIQSFMQLSVCCQRNGSKHDKNAYNVFS